MVKLETTLATFSNKAGDPFQARLTQAVVLNGKTVIPAGAMVEGRVTKVAEPRRISGKPTIGILPEALILPTGERFSSMPRWSTPMPDAAPTSTRRASSKDPVTTAATS